MACDRGVSKNITISKRSIDAAEADRVVRTVCEKAAELGISVVGAVTDEAGFLKALARQDGAAPLAVEIATNKAYTAAVSGVSTEMWFDIIKSDPPLLHGLPHTNRFVAFGGGIPIMADGALVGAVGVSGGHYSQDIQCAAAGVAAFDSLDATPTD